jgi:alkanesulfonate monooxygenase SsuD/methylene tetrahydromethanopterin reductase-like flavin-dependent oxidoreductase (luciferase family)
MTPGRRPEFGVFTEFSQAPGVSEATAFVLAAPLAIAAALAGRTSRIKLGIAVQVLPLSHPLHIAEDVATASPTARAAIGQRLIDITYDEVIEEFAVYGTPEAVTDRLLELREALGYRRSRCG